KNAGNGRANAFLEPAELHAVAIVSEQLGKVGLRERTTVCPRAELGKNLLRAEVLVVAIRGMAGENALAARCRAQARSFERTADLERADAVHAVLPTARHEHLDLIVRFGERLATERHADFVRPGSRGEPNVLEPRIDLLH